MTRTITIDPRETALVVLDMQNGFCDPNGRMANSKLACEQQNRIIPAVRELVSVCNEAGIHVMFSLQRHYPSDVARGRRKIPTHMRKLGVDVCTKDSWDAELIDQLKDLVRPEDDVFEKRHSSCFYNTTLESKLKVRGITTLIVCCVATNNCVESTIRDADARDYDIILNQNLRPKGRSMETSNIQEGTPQGAGNLPGIIGDVAASLWEDLHSATFKNTDLKYGVVMSLATLKCTLMGQIEALAA